MNGADTALWETWIGQTTAAAAVLPPHILQAQLDADREEAAVLRVFKERQ